MCVHLFCRSSSNITYQEMGVGENNDILGRHHKNTRLNTLRLFGPWYVLQTQLIHADIRYRFGRLHENGSTEQEKAGFTALPFFFYPTSCMPAIMSKKQNTCLEPIKNQASKYLRLPKVIFNDIDSLVPIGSDNLHFLQVLILR